MKPVKDLPDTAGTIIAKRFSPGYRNRYNIVVVFAATCATFCVMLLAAMLWATLGSAYPVISCSIVVVTTLVLGAKVQDVYLRTRKADTIHTEFAAWISTIPEGWVPGILWLIKHAQHNWSMLDREQKVMLALKNSPHEVEREHLFCGFFNGTTLPFLLHIPLVMLGVLITGAIGSGKTMKVLASILYQLVARKRFGIIVLDMKGDSLFAKFLRWLCVQFKQPFQHFSIDRGRASMTWNPLLDSALKGLNPTEKAAVLTQACGVEFAGCGPEHFASRMRTLLAAAFKYRPGIQSFRELLDVLTFKQFRKASGITEKDYEDGGDIVNHIRELAAVPQLNCVAGEQIDIGTAVLAPGLHYFHLPPSVNEAVSRAVGRLVVRLVFFASRARGAKGPEMILAIDEVNLILQRTLEIPIKQARDCRVSFVLTLQNLSDAKTNDRDFTDTLTANTAVKFTCTAMDDTGRKRITAVGGEKEREVVSHTQSTGETATGQTSNASVQTRTEIVPAFGADEINQLNADRDLIFVEANPDSGFTALNGPQFIRMDYPIDEFKIGRINREEWTEPDGVKTFLGVDIKASPLPREATPEPEGGAPAPKPTPKPKAKTPDPGTAAAEIAEHLKKLAGR